MIYLDNVLLGLLFSASIAALAYRRGSLAPSGAVGAVLVGTLIFGFGGWVWGLTLITFFASSSAWSHYKEVHKASLTEKFAKGHRRDLGQTLANGGGAATLALAFALSGEPLLYAAFLGALATVNADTWATELGVLNPTPPRLITTGGVVEVGTSGGVSWLGMAASAGGGLLIGLVAFSLSVLSEAVGYGAAPEPGAWMIPASLVAGVAGSLFDSLLGATVQAIYYCPRCAKETERPLHGCGTATRHQRGWRWLNNDAVNFASSWVGALVALGLALLL